MAINMVLASGMVKSPALRYDQQSRPEYRFTLEQRDGDFCLWLPCFTPGAGAERLAGELEEGMHICITSGRLAYKKRPTKAGEQSRLEVLVWAIERLQDSTRTDHEASPAAVAPMRPRSTTRRRARLRRTNPASRGMASLDSNHGRLRV